MVDKKETKKAEDKKDFPKKVVKKLDDVKESPENKKAIAAQENRESKIENRGAEEKSKPAVAKENKKEKKASEKVELVREYVVPLKKGVLNVPQYRRAKKAVRVLKEFMVRHMGVRDRDLRKVKIDRYLNEEIWFRGIKKPMNKVHVLAKKIDGVVYVELAEVPEVVKFKIDREARLKAEAGAAKVKMPKHAKEKEDDDKDKDGVSDKKEEAEDKKAGAEMEAKVEKAVSKEMKHTAQGKHFKKTMPIRKALKK